MKRSIVPIVLLTLLLCAPDARTQTATTGATTSNQRNQKSSFTEKLLKFLGISDSPGTLKGPGDEVASGEVWIADLDSGTTRALTSGSGYRSPIFLAGTDEVLVLRGADVLRISLRGGESRKLYSLQGVLKLVASNPQDPANILVLLRGQEAGRPRVGLASVATGTVTIVPYDSGSSQDLQMLENLQGWSRTYGDHYVFVRRQTRQALSGKVEWSEVFLQVDGGAPVDVSRCDGDNCGQPSLSEQQKFLVFIKSKAE